MTDEGLGLSKADAARVIVQVIAYAESRGASGAAAEVLAEAVHEMEGVAIDAVMWDLWREGSVVVGWGDDGLVWVATEHAADGAA